MWDDPIVQEVHRTREALAAEYGFDVKAIFADLRKRQTSLGGRLVRQTKRVEATAQVDQGRPLGSPDSAPSEVAPAT
jgi:hypothetical protein